eukprot:CAMPEP_0201475146 /NCGR_PEP_ID=MMETSP0151_2-20130828/596_1 /ASSEMBLY_ACC=CAM_ASM_000257 /TAXON_ID=200890 /ORGANISM="Paramoeba atlantica, Strain 621/1 / CCAP 1560/9" /LENGTH=413 /DNA_ID=CAMNT_0047855161 /DNA_START=48 /DNA_END=1289 /DNA_ORIENTATION=-
MSRRRGELSPISPLEGAPGDIVSFGINEDTEAPSVAHCRFGEEGETVECDADSDQKKVQCRVPPKSPTDPNKTWLYVDLNDGYSGDRESDLEEGNGSYSQRFQYEYNFDRSSCFRQRLKRLREARDRLPMVVWVFLAETIGTLLLTFMIIGTVSSAVLTGNNQGILQVGLPSGIGVFFSIYLTAEISGAHLNPAVSIALAIFRPRDFKWTLVPVYVTGQMLGAILAGFVNYWVFLGAIENYEEIHHIKRGSCESVATASCFGEYFPNPGGVGNWYGVGHEIYPFCDPDYAASIIGIGGALVVESVSTCILMLVILGLTDESNSFCQKNMAPGLIGMTVAACMSLFTIIQLGMNPARDFGPRIAALAFGWGSVAVPGPLNGFWVYIIGPIIGAIVACILNDHLLPRHVVVARRS